MKTTKIIAIAVTVWMSLFTLTLIAQPPPGPPSSSAPIDGGAIALLIGAATLGYKKIRENRTKKSE